MFPGRSNNFTPSVAKEFFPISLHSRSEVVGLLYAIFVTDTHPTLHSRQAIAIRTVMSSRLITGVPLSNFGPYLSPPSAELTAQGAGRSLPSRTLPAASP